MCQALGSELPSFLPSQLDFQKMKYFGRKLNWKLWSKMQRKVSNNLLSLIMGKKIYPRFNHETYFHNWQPHCRFSVDYFKRDLFKRLSLILDVFFLCNQPIAKASISSCSVSLAYGKTL